MPEFMTIYAETVALIPKPSGGNACGSVDLNFAGFSGLCHKVKNEEY